MPVTAPATGGSRSSMPLRPWPPRAATRNSARDPVNRHRQPAMPPRYRWPRRQGPSPTARSSPVEPPSRSRADTTPSLPLPIEPRRDLMLGFSDEYSRPLRILRLRARSEGSRPSQMGSRDSVSALGALMSAATYLITLTFLFTTPGVAEPTAGGFLPFRPYRDSFSSRMRFCWPLPSCCCSLRSAAGTPWRPHDHDPSSGPVGNPCTIFVRHQLVCGYMA